MAKQFSKEDLDALKEQMLAMGEAQASMTDNLKSYAEVLLEVKKNYFDIKNVQNQVGKSEKIIRDKAKEVNEFFVIVSDRIKFLFNNISLMSGDIEFISTLFIGISRKYL